MKRKGSISQIYLKRDGVEIPRLYRCAKQIAEYPTTVIRLCEIAASLPVQQYYISDDAAICYIRNRILRKKDIVFRSPYKQKLYSALYDEVSSMLREEKYRKMGLVGTVLCALSRPAPCVGLTPLVFLQTLSCSRTRRLSYKSNLQTPADNE